MNNYSPKYYNQNRSFGSNNNQQRSYSSPRRIVTPEETQFLSGIPIDPSPRIYLEKGSKELTMRAMDLICPIGMGQRGLIVAPPGSGKTTFLKHICQAVAGSCPEMKIYCLLVDERPEEVTEFRRNAMAEVRWSSSDNEHEQHILTADEVMRDAFRDCATGKNVMILIDSLTRLSRVHNAKQGSGRTMSGGVDARALEVPRRIFGAARKIEQGGSLTILATILVETGSRMDEVIFEEFKGTGNMEIVLSREIASYRLFPAIDFAKSDTRKSELLCKPDEYQQITQLRRALVGMNKVEAAKFMIESLKKYPTNQEFLATFK